MNKKFIYKYTRIGDHNDVHIEYDVDKKRFLQIQKEDIEQGFSIEDDKIEKIEFDINNLESLCEALNT